MRRHATTTGWLALALASGLFGGVARAEDAAGGVDSVVVFGDRARVTRLRTVRCERGVAQAAFDHLPEALDPRTLRGEAVGAAEAIGLASDLVQDPGEESGASADARATPLLARQRKLEADLKANDGQQATVSAQQSDVSSYANLYAGALREEMRNPHPATPAWAQSLDAVRARRAALDEERRKLVIAARALRLAADKTDRELQQLGQRLGAHAYRTATVTLGCRALREVTASLSYVVPGATWQPEYDLDFLPHGHAKVGPGTARLTVGAVVRQSTGEDWHNVRLSLSTARPKLGTEAPRLAPMLVDGYEQQREKVLVQASERRDLLQAGAPDAAGGAASVALDDKGNAFLLTVPHRVTIVADGRPVWAPVDVTDSPAVSRLVATPKLDAHVYQVVAMRNPAPYPLLDGRVRSYRAGSYVGDTHLSYRGLGEPFEVSLGVDEAIRVERQVIEEQDRDASFLSTTKHIERAYRLKVGNRASDGQTVELRENVPISKIDEVKVELVAGKTTPGYALDRVRGFLTWTLPLKTGEERAVDLAYTIHLPDSWQVGAAP